MLGPQRSENLGFAGRILLRHGALQSQVREDVRLDIPGSHAGATIGCRRGLGLVRLLSLVGCSIHHQIDL